jgi:hypothetical protein
MRMSTDHQYTLTDGYCHVRMDIKDYS